MAFVHDVVTRFVFKKLSQITQVTLTPLPLNTFPGYKLKEAARWLGFSLMSQVGRSMLCLVSALAHWIYKHEFPLF